MRMPKNPLARRRQEREGPTLRAGEGE
jgi:hypothetical protein